MQGFDITMAESGEVCDNLVSSRFANVMMRNVASTLDAGDVFTREQFIRNSTEGNLNATIKTWDLIELFLDHLIPALLASQSSSAMKWTWQRHFQKSSASSPQQLIGSSFVKPATNNSKQRNRLHGHQRRKELLHRGLDVSRRKVQRR